MPTNDRQHGCTGARIHGVGIAARDFVTPGRTAAKIGRRQHVAYVSVSHDLAHEFDLGRRGGLCAHHCPYLALLGELRKLDRFCKAISKRPFTVDMLASLQCRSDDFTMVGNFDRYCHDVDVRGVH